MQQNVRKPTIEIYFEVAFDFKGNFLINRFKTNESLRAHSKKQERYRCSACERAFCSEQKLIDHNDHRCSGINARDDESVATADDEEEEDEINEIESKPTFVDCSSGMDLEQETGLEANVKLEPEPEMEPFTTSVDSVPLQIQIDVDIRPECSKFAENSSENKDDREYQCHLCNKR